MALFACLVNYINSRWLFFAMQFGDCRSRICAGCGDGHLEDVIMKVNDRVIMCRLRFVVYGVKHCGWSGQK